MGFAHEDAVWTLRFKNPHAHHVLLALAHHACSQCGVTWLGVRSTSERTGIGTTAVREALAELTREDLIRVFRYPKGGRGRSTEYIVLPNVVKLSTPLCGKCVEKQESHRTGGGYDKSGTDKSHRTGGGFKGNPPESGVKTHRTGGDQPVSTDQPGSATHSVRREAVASPPISNHPASPSPEHYAENARQASEMVARLSGQKSLPNSKPRDPRND